jgi:hypothetical protein
MFENDSGFLNWLNTNGYQANLKGGDGALRIYSPTTNGGEGGAIAGLGATNLYKDYRLANRYSNPEIFGTAGDFWSGLYNIGSNDSSSDVEGYGDQVANINGTQYWRLGRNTDLNVYDPFGGGYFRDNTYGWVVPYEVQKAYIASQQDGWDTLGDMGPLLALGGIAAVTAPAIMAGAGAAAGEGAAAGVTGSGFGSTGAFGAGAGLTPETLGTFGSIGTNTFGTGGALGGASSLGGGVDFLASMGNLAAPFGETGSLLGNSVFGSIPTGGSFGWESFLPGGNLTGMGAGAPLGTSSGSIWDTLLNRSGSLLKSIVAPQDEKGTDWGKVLMSLGNYFANERNADQIRQLMQQQDPFGPQRPFYQDVLKQSFSDPNFLQNNPTFQAMYDPAIRDVKARMAARGLNHSGNALHEIMRTGTETAAKYMLPFQTMTGQFAGSGIDPRVSGLLGMNAANADMTALGNIGVGLQEIWKTLNKGPQVLY